MKIRKILSALALVACSLSLLSFVSSSDNGPSVIIKKGKISIDKQVVNDTWALTSFTAKLGEADRAAGEYNKVHTYDKKNICLFEGIENGNPTGVVKEFQIHFKVETVTSNTPTGETFTGTFKVDKLVVTKYLTPDEMKKKLTKWSVTDSYIEHSYRMASKGIYIYFQFNDSETMLLKCSIGPDKKK